MRINNYVREEKRAGRILQSRPAGHDWTRAIIHVRVFNELPVLLNGIEQVNMRAEVTTKGIAVDHRFSGTRLLQSVGIVLETGCALVWHFPDTLEFGKTRKFECTFQPPDVATVLPFYEKHVTKAVRTLAVDVYNSSDAELTRSYYDLLEHYGIVGRFALNLFRALKCSDRAAKYTDLGHRTKTLGRKRYSIESLVAILNEHATALGITWGWRTEHHDPKYVSAGAQAAPHALYMNLPTGQVRFHSPARMTGPEYTGETNLDHYGRATRVIKFCDRITEIPL